MESTAQWGVREGRQGLGAETKVAGKGLALEKAGLARRMTVS